MEGFLYLIFGYFGALVYTYSLYRQLNGLYRCLETLHFGYQRNVWVSPTQRAREHGKFTKIHPSTTWAIRQGEVAISALFDRIRVYRYGNIYVYLPLPTPYHPWDWYIYLHEWLIFYGFQYTSPMDGMG